MKNKRWVIGLIKNGVKWYYSKYFTLRETDDKAVEFKTWNDANDRLIQFYNAFSKDNTDKIFIEEIG